jgi:exopolysaccharide biosynthesis polyprenyl glycosylphosphotransferase
MPHVVEAPAPTRRPLRVPRPRFRREPTDTRGPQAIYEGSSQFSEICARDRRYRWALATSDTTAAAMAIGLATILSPDRLRWATLLGLPLVVAVSKVQGLYDRDELLIRKTTVDEAPKIFQLATLFTLTFWLCSTALLTGPLGHNQALALWGALFIFAVSGRRVARGLVRRGVAAERCMFVGDASSYQRLRDKFQTTDVNAELVGRMNPMSTRPRIGDASERHLRDVLGWTRAHRLIIEPQALPPEEALDVVRAAKSIGVRVSLLPRVLDVVGSSVVFDHLDGVTVLGVRRFGLTRSSRLTKRVLDLVGASLILLAAGPLMLLLALAIKLDSRGPVFFRQTRVGRNGRHFRIFKFRTMVPEAEALKAALRARNECPDGLFKISADPRVTRVGRFLRRTSLDELPQLLNVVLGDMSLVGPRPLVVDEDRQIIGWDRRRLHLTPGMTGPWQIAGSSRIPLSEMVKIDYLYVAGWSLWEDLKILLRTVPYVVSRRGM